MWKSNNKQQPTTTKVIPKEYVWNTIPEILYETPEVPGGAVNPIPYIEVPKEKKMPAMLFLFGYHKTDEYETDPNTGVPQEIVEQLPYKYVNLNFLFEQLPATEHDKIRGLLGMKPLEQAKKEGQQLLDLILKKEEMLKQQISESQGSRKQGYEDDYKKASEKIEKLRKVIKTQPS
jgi:hypothetical protein